MRVHIAAILLVGLCAHLVGCGSSSNGGSQVSTIRINPQTLSPFSLQMNAGSTVQWINADTALRQVVSGALDQVPFGRRKTVRVEIQANNTFIPSLVDANFGDTIEWHNNRLTDFTLEIYDENGTLIATLNFGQGQIVPFSAFPSAGGYNFRQQNNPTFSGFIKLYGIPRPNNLFTSQVLATGDTFIRAFPSAGTFTFYVLDMADTSRAFLDGTIVVQ